MKLGSSCLPLLAAGLLLGVLHGPAFGQGADGGLDSATLLKPSADSWPTYHGTYSGQHHSRLAQITPANVYRVTLAWAFETGQTAQIKATPILVNGILYATTPDNVWALDARSANVVWHYTYPPNQGLHIGHRGVAVYRDSVYFTTPDAHLISLDARDGKVKWNVVIADVKKGYWTTMAPLAVRDHIIVGTSGDFDNLAGMLKSFDPETGNDFSMPRSEEHTSELQSRGHLVCRLLLEKKKNQIEKNTPQ